MTLRGKTFIGLVVALVLCLAVAVTATFWDHGSDDLTITDAAAPPAQANTSSPTVTTGRAGAGSGLTSSPTDRSTTRAAATARSNATTRGGSPATKRATRTSKPTSSGTTQGSPTNGVFSAPVTSVKKGAALWKTAGIDQALGDSGVSWFYNWSPNRDGVSAPGVEFVPMMWGAGSVTDANLATAKAGAKVLLGFNEPDMSGQANMSVDQALSLWPKLQSTGLRLGAPAVAYGADTPNGWLDRFMTGAKAKGYRVDFIPLHWYGSDFNSANATQQLKSYVQAVYNRYHKPIWITEYALMNFGSGTKLPSASVQADFVKKSTAMLQGLSYVERYAWFAFPTSTDGTDGTGLYRGTTPTLPGQAYRAAG